MKNIVLGIAILGVVGFVSCKKEYTCDCVDLLGVSTGTKTAKGKTGEEACNDAATKVLGVPAETCTPQ